METMKPIRAPSTTNAGLPWAMHLLVAVTLVASVACAPVYVNGDEGYYAANATNGQDPSLIYGELNGYGSWTWSSQWGRVWVPYANRTPGWRPYTVGQWSYTEYGWTWVSEEPWGASPYHYGRWGWEANVGGWAWVPGTTWAPAWVAWRSGGGCVGWAPLGPAGVVYSTANYWVFVQQSNIHHSHVHTVIVDQPQGVQVYRQSVVIGTQQRIRNGSGGAVAYNAGPQPSVVQSWTGQPVQPRPAASFPSTLPRARQSATPAARATPGYQPAARATPGYQPAARATPGYQPAPRASPGYQPAPRATPGYQPAPRTAPSYQPAPRPAPGYQPAPRTAPSYQPSPRPSPRNQPEARPAPSYQPAPGSAAPRANRSQPYQAQPRSRNSSSSSKSKSRRDNERAPAPAPAASRRR